MPNPDRSIDTDQQAAIDSHDHQPDSPHLKGRQDIGERMRIATLEAQVASLDREREALREQVATLERQLESLEKERDRLEETVEREEERRQQLIEKYERLLSARSQPERDVEQDTARPFRSKLPHLLQKRWLCLRQWLSGER